MAENTEPYPDDNFFTAYFNYIGYPDNTEASLTIHRWCAISLLGALLGRNFTFPFGFFNLTPNQYIQIVGVPATKKSTAIKIATKLLAKSGYNNFAAEKTSQQQFLIDLHNITWGESDEEASEESLLEKNVFGSMNPKETAESLTVAEMYVASDEFVDFIGRNNMDFISLLGTLWDYDSVFSLRLKHSKAVYINKPTINIISGNTHEGFNIAFPPEVQGQGFFSRLLLIHAESTGRKITFLSQPSEDATNKVLDFIHKIKSKCIGNATITEEATALCRPIYEDWIPIDDARFAKYSGRRYIHMLKLAMICAAARLSTVIDSQDIIMANTLLSYAEYSMPKAMGEFGKGKHSAVTHKILELINNSDVPVGMPEIIKQVHMDVDNLSTINDLLNSLKAANKIQQIDGGKFLSKKPIRSFEDSALIKPSWLWPEERKY